MSTALVLRDLEARTAWELRSAWAAGRRVALTLDLADPSRIEGTVSAVAATGVTATVARVLVPLELVLAVHLPSRLGDSNAREAFHGPGRRVVPPDEELFL